MLKWFRTKKLEEVLHQKKTILVKGIRFQIQKINLLNFLDGSNVLKQHYDVYKTGKEAEMRESEKKVRKYYSEVLVAGVVSPKFVFKDPKENEYLIDDLFNDWDLVDELHTKIMELTYGKKKVKRLTSHGPDSKI